MQGGDDGAGHLVLVDGGGEIDEPHSVVEPAVGCSGDPRGDARLADAGGAPQGHESMVREQAGELGDDLLATEQVELVGREVVEAGGRRPQRREGVDQTCCLGLVYPDRAVEAAHEERSEIAEADAARQPACARRRCRVRDKDLSTVTGRLQPGGQVGRTTEHVTATEPTDARVDADAHIQDVDGRPVQRRNLPLDLDGRAHRIGGVGEQRQDAVAGRLDDPAALRRHGGGDEIVVLVDDHLHLVGMALPEVCAVGDVGQQDRRRDRG